MRLGWLGKYSQVLENNIENGVTMKADKDKKLIKRMDQHDVDDDMFLSIDQTQDSKKERSDSFQEAN